MIDINKIRSNYQKLATINSKCDTVVKQQASKLSQQTTTLGHQQKQLSSSNGKKLPSHKSQTASTNQKIHNGVGTTLTVVKSRSNSITNTAATVTSLKQSVRAANKNFFLSHEFKDQNFLREECKLAQAQVTAGTAGRAGNTQNQSHHNIRHQSQQNLNNNNTTASTTASHNQPYATNNNNKYSKLTLLSRSAPAATSIANGMRRTTTTTTAHSSSSTAAAQQQHQMGTTSVHRLDLGLQQFKVLPPTTTAAAAAGLTKPTNPTAAATKSFLNSRHHLTTTQVRPLVHRTIPTTVLTAATAHGTALTTASSKLSQNLHNPHQHHHHHSLQAVSSNGINNNNNSSSNGISKDKHQNLSNAAAHSNNNNINCTTNRMNEHDDIKFIDSDEATTTVPANSAAATSAAASGANSTALNAAQQRFASILNDIGSATAVSSGQKTRVRPKSTIICSSNNLVFEKINNYKYANGVASNGSMSGTSAVTNALEASGQGKSTASMANATSNVNTTVTSLKHPTTTASLGIRTRTPTPTPPTTKTTAPTTTTSSHSIASASRRSDLRYAGIDSNSIKASIAKFNSLSEQKRLPPLTGVTMRSHANSSSTTSSGGGGSTHNLQHHRHSSDLDNCQTRLLANDSSSPTRSPYRSNASAAVSTATKVMSSMQSIASSSSSSSHHTHSHAIAISPLVSNNANNSSVNCNSLPLKSSSKGFGVNATRPTEFSASSLTRDIRLQTTTALSTAGTTAATSAKITTEQRSALPTAGTAVDSADSSSSVRTTSRNALPPSSPTSTRYWDRDSTRTSSTNYGSSSTNADTIKSSSDEKNEGLCGLRNIGNTCFMNSVIQCLSHTIELTRFLKAYNSMRSSGTKDEHILKEFAKLIQEMWSGNTGSVTPSDLKRAFSAKHRMYSDFNQQDAQEFLRFFLDSLHSALNSGVKGEPLKIEDHLSDNKKAELTWEWYTRIENSLIRDLFVGQLKSTLRCTTCGNTSVTFDPFWDLSVPLPSSSRCKLDACLDLFIREEVLDGDEMPTCSKCKQRRKCTKSFSIQRFPKYLVIHLKRFSETRWSKMTNIVEFPTGDRELNMAPYGANSNTNMHYSLYAISNHMGSTAGGHYVALCKHPVSKRWHEFNDNIVSGALSENHLVSSSAYILFYERA